MIMVKKQNKENKGLDELSDRINSLLAENVLLTEKKKSIEKLNSIKTGGVSQESISILSEYYNQLLPTLELAEKNKTNKDAVDKIRNSVDETLDFFIQTINEKFNAVYRRMDCSFYFLKHDSEQKSSVYRVQLDEIVNLYSDLVSNLNVKPDKLNTKFDSKLVSYNALLNKIIPLKQKLNSLLEKYAKEAFSSEQDFILTKCELEEIHKNYNSEVKAHRPARILSYHTPFEFKEQFKYLHPLEREIKEMSREYEAINEYKNCVLRDTALINSVFSQLEQLLCIEEPEKSSLDDISRMCKAGQTNFQQDLHLDAEYPVFLGKVSEGRTTSSGLLGNKKTELKNKMNNLLMQEFSNLAVSPPNSLEKIPAYLHTFDLMPVADFLEKFKALGNLEYVVKCNNLESRIKEEKTYFSEVLSVNLQLVQDCGRISESMADANSLLSKIQNKGVDETALVNVRNLVNSGFDSGKYSKYSDDSYLNPVVKKYQELIISYSLIKDSLFETALQKINADVDGLKGADIARVDHALSLFEILSNVKEPSQKIREKISQLEELRDELKKEQQYSPVRKQQAQDKSISFELSDLFKTIKVPESFNIRKISSILKGETDEPWNYRFRSAAEEVSKLSPTNNLQELSYIKALALTLKESLAEGELRKAIHCYGISERLVREIIDRIRDYVGLSEQRILARAA